VRLYHTTKPADAENPTDITPTLSAMTVNDKLPNHIFLEKPHRVITSPFQKADLLGKFSVTIQTKGGGVSAQAFAIRHGIARALVSFNEDLRKKLKVFGYLTRDPRVVERKKYGLKKARRAPQWSKR
jgi:small subunit ribosomal protein S9